MSMKQAAEELLKIADDIEKDAAKVTQFVCPECNHTATLAKINERRKAAASEVGENIAVSDITVNDKIACPACEGVMAYAETITSQPYYFDPDKVAADAPHDETKETPAEEAAESPETQKKEKEEGTEKHDQPKQASLDYDSLERYIK